MKLRKATREDCWDLYNWRNDLQTRHMSFDTNEISFNDHVKWLEKSFKNKELKLYIAENGANKIGVVRFDRKDQYLIVSINLNPTFRGQGLAAQVLDLAVEDIGKHWKFDKIIAQIKPRNKASIRLFEKCGFIQKECVNDMLIYTKK